MERSKELLFEVSEDALFVANGGRTFSRTGVISACASHLSDKVSGNVTDHFEASDERLIKAILEKELQVYRADVNRMTSDFRNEEETAHDYGGRFLWELLQNADDAMGTGRSSDDLIGSKGLGFKAVLEITAAPEIHSGSFHFHFSVERTQSLLRGGFPDSSPPPLTFRIPHECPPCSHTQTLLASGYTTVIRLPFRNSEARETTVDRLNALNPSFLLLTQELTCIRLSISGSETLHEVSRSSPGFSSGEVMLSTRSPGKSLSTSWHRWILQRPAPTETTKQLTVGICLPTRHGIPVPCDSRIPLHVFFPTEEEGAARALLHASFDLEHNRKRTRKGKHDTNILLNFAHLFQDVLSEIPPRCALEAFGEIDAEDDHTPLNLLQNQIRTQLLETSFIPVIGGERVKPEEVKIWDSGLGAVLRHDPQEVCQAKLLTPDLLDLRHVLRELNSCNLDTADFARLLRYCRNGSIHECIESWRVLVSSLEKAGEFLDGLRHVPCWYTDTGARSLEGSHPLLLKRPPDWPNWLPADSLHPQLREELSQWEKGTQDKETAPLWKQLIAARLLRGRREYLEHALLPFIATWDMAHWEVRGWAALRQVLCWSEEHTFKATDPWIEDLDRRRGKEAILRGHTANTLRLPTDKGWLPAADCYAGEAWSGPPAFDRYFEGVRDRGVLRSSVDWPASIKNGANQDQWMGFLRWSGVSWEPKVRRHVGDLPDHHLMESYRDEIPSHHRWLVDWIIECFPDCLLQRQGGTPASVIRTMIPLVTALEQRRARYFRSRYFEKKGERQWADHSFAAHQLRNQEWLPCREALFHGGRWVAPSQAFLPGRGLRGLLPEVHRAGLEDEEWYQQIDPALRSLGVRDHLPSDPLDWHLWMRRLPELFGLASDLPEIICEVLYRRYLQLELVEELPEDIDIPCIAWKDGSGELEFAPPCQVFHVDQPHFEEVRNKILREGYRLFILRLNAGEQAPRRLGIRPLSDVLQAKPVHETSDHQETRLFLQRYSDRRRGLSLAASLAEELPEELDLEAVRRLRLRLDTNSVPVTDVEVLSWLTEDHRLLVNLDKDNWRALGHGLAVWIAREEDRASMFENLLRESDREEYLDRLRQEGVTEDDILDAGGIWKGAPLSKEQSVSSDGTPSMEVEEREPRSQPTGGQVEPLEPADSQSRPDTQPTSAGPRPRPELGLAAEDWFAERLARAFPGAVLRHDRDDENRESDFVIDRDPRIHIEVKHVASRPGTFHWSGLQCEKALVLEGSAEEYYMAVLFPEGEQEYEVRWLWRPLEELRRVGREVQWAGTSGYHPVDTDSWDVSSRQPMSVPTKRYEFRIRLTDETLAVLARDTGKLEGLRTRIRNQSPRSPDSTSD